MSELSRIAKNIGSIKPFITKAAINYPSKSQIKQSGTDVKKATAAIQQGVIRASTEVERVLPQYLNDAMVSPVWGPFSPKQPYSRANGEIVSTGLRDLVDMGNLHGSMSIKVSFLQTRTNIQIKYGAPYARLVHEGGVIQPWGNQYADSVVLPARPWITSVLTPGGPVQPYDYTKVYNDEIASAWNSV